MCTCFRIPPSVADFSERSQDRVAVFVSLQVELDPGLVAVVNYCYLSENKLMRWFSPHLHRLMLAALMFDQSTHLFDFLLITKLLIQ